MQKTIETAVYKIPVIFSNLYTSTHKLNQFKVRAWVFTHIALELHMMAWFYLSIFGILLSRLWTKFLFGWTSSFAKLEPASHESRAFNALRPFCLRRTNLENQWHAITENHTKVIESGKGQDATLWSRAVTEIYWISGWYMRHTLPCSDWYVRWTFQWQHPPTQTISQEFL